MFTAHVKENMPLSSLLADPRRNVLDNASGVSRAWLEDQTDDALVEHYLQEWDQRFPPAVVGDVIPAPEPWQTERRAMEIDDPNDRLPVWRWFVRFRVAGQTETLTRWPAHLDEEPCGDGIQFHPIPWVSWERSAGDLLGFFDVPYDEDPAGTALPGKRILRATAYLHAAAEAANAEVAECRAEVEAKLRSLLVDRRERLEVIERQRLDLIELVREQFGPIEIERVEDPLAPTAVEDATGKEIVLNYVLSDGSFDQLVAVTRKWAVGAERYPSAFGPLQEEAITSLLVTTLNVAFDIAHREVFQGEGKTDIFVQAKLGESGEAAHIGEAKVWDGQKKVHTGSDDEPSHVEQLLGYGNSRTERMLLIYYVRGMNLELVERRAGEALALCSAFKRWEEAGDALTAVMHHPKYGNEIRVSVLFVHLPVENAPAS